MDFGTAPHAKCATRTTEELAAGQDVRRSIRMCKHAVPAMDMAHATTLRRRVTAVRQSAESRARLTLSTVSVRRATTQHLTSNITALSATKYAYAKTGIAMTGLVGMARAPASTAGLALIVTSLAQAVP
jgi:hypothetical protein